MRSKGFSQEPRGTISVLLSVLPREVMEGKVCAICEAQKIEGWCKDCQKPTRHCSNPSCKNHRVCPVPGNHVVLLKRPDFG